MPILPPKFSEIERLTPLQHYMMDIMTVGPNLAGLPHMNINAGFENKLPVGMMLIGDHLMEKNIIHLFYQMCQGDNGGGEAGRRQYQSGD